MKGEQIRSSFIAYLTQRGYPTSSAATSPAAAIWAALGAVEWEEDAPG